MLWLAATGVACLLVTWGYLALNVAVSIDPSIAMPGSWSYAFQCQGVETSLWPGWLPLPDTNP